MKIAILSESSADEAAVRILVEALLSQSAEPVPLKLRSRGWPSVRQVLPTILLHLHFRTDADGLAVVVDSNSSPLQAPVPEEAARGGPGPRSDQLAAVVQDFRNSHPKRPGQAPLRVAIGVAAPAIEAWHLCGRDPRASEAAWLREMEQGAHPRHRVNEMKRALYGTDRPSLASETEHAVRETERVVGDLALLEQLFPIGFGSLAAAVRGWRPLDNTL